jgi:hypothetical protein
MSPVVETHRLSDSNLFKQVRIGTGFIRFESGRHRLKPVAGVKPNLRLQLWRWLFVAMSPVVKTHRLSDSNLFKQVRIGTGFIRFVSGRHRF